MEATPPLSWIAHPVRVQLVAGGKMQSIDGNLYTVDPVTGSLVLLQFQNKNPTKLIWIPREGYVYVNMLEESSLCCEQHSVELADVMGSMFGMRQIEAADAAEMEKRRDRLVTWLRSNHVDVKECDDRSLLIFGMARIQAPYNEDSCYCDNAIILKRLRGLVGKVPE